MNHEPRYENVCSFGALLAAFRKARQAKRGKNGEPAFYLELESNLLDLCDQLKAHAFVPDPYRYFSLHNKKDRVVSVASFRDRVVHHALVAELEPFYEELFIPTSFACRKGMGMHRALKLAYDLCRRHGYFLKLDIRKYFDHISHPLLLEILAEDVHDKEILWLCETLLAHAGVPGVEPSERRGVPIGNLTSQFWANVYLNRLDQAVAGPYPGLPYLRYMDDILVFGTGKEELWAVQRFVDGFVVDRLALELKESATLVAPVSEGIPWLGFRVYPGTVRLDQGSRIRFIRKACGNFRAAANVSHDEMESLVASASSIFGHVRHCDSLMFRRSLLARHGRD